MRPVDAHIRDQLTRHLDEIGGKLDAKDVLKRNTRINIGTVTAHEELERKLKKLGVEIKPSYNLEPPLGRNPTRFHNRNG